MVGSGTGRAGGWTGRQRQTPCCLRSRAGQRDPCQLPGAAPHPPPRACPPPRDLFLPPPCRRRHPLLRLCVRGVRAAGGLHPAPARALAGAAGQPAGSVGQRHRRRAGLDQRARPCDRPGGRRWCLRLACAASAVRRASGGWLQCPDRLGCAGRPCARAAWQCPALTAGPRAPTPRACTACCIIPPAYAAATPRAGVCQPRPAGAVPAQELRPLQARPHRRRAPLCAGGRVQPSMGGWVGGWVGGWRWHRSGSRLPEARCARL